jgi:catechol 2,3-dioxygenase-like lactoylglutathione lyase family enzyme
MNLATVEIKVFVPARDFEQSQRFYADCGFTRGSVGGGIAHFSAGACSFLLQDFYDEGLANNLMLHLLVENVDDWHAHLRARDLPGRFGVKLGEPQDQPWAMRDFVLTDPSGVLWRLAQPIARAG